ncbi:hypothetical protein ACT3RT_04290 [Ewingella sp. AOP9-I1-14]
MNSAISSVPLPSTVKTSGAGSSSGPSGSTKASGFTAAGQAKQVSVSSKGSGAMASEWKMSASDEQGKASAQDAGGLKSVTPRSRQGKAFVGAEGEDQAARLVTYAMRRNMGQKIHKQMLAEGARWDDLTPETTVKSLSRENIKGLHIRLQGPALDKPLAPYEKAFMKRLLESPLSITHATNALDKVQNTDTGVVSLSSRQKLVRDGVPFPKDNTSKMDIQALANDDNVFFALESGEKLQKPSSRFGKSVMRFDLDSPAVQQHATLHLFDVLNGFPEAVKHLNTLKSLPHRDQMQTAHMLDKHEHSRYGMDPKGSLFQGKDMKRGLGLAIIDRTRALPEGLRASILEKEDINALINGLFRPQVLVPRMFVGKPTDISEVENIRSAAVDAGALDALLTSYLDAADSDSDSESDEESLLSDYDLPTYGSAAPFSYDDSSDEEFPMGSHATSAAIPPFIPDASFLSSSPTSSSSGGGNPLLGTQSPGSVSSSSSSGSFRAPSDTDAADTLLEMMNAFAAEDAQALL